MKDLLYAILGFYIIGAFILPIMGMAIVIILPFWIVYVIISSLFKEPEIRVSHCHKCRHTVTSKMTKCRYCHWIICENCRSCGCDWYEY